mgnify:CR=1 FL=1
MIFNKAHYIFLLLSLFLMWNSVFYAQNDDFRKADSLIKIGKYISAERVLNQIDTFSISKANKAFRYFLLAKLYDSKNVVDQATSTYLQAKKYYLQIDSFERAQQINLDLFYILSASENLSNKAERYLDEYFSYAKKSNDSLMLAIGYEKMAVSLMTKDPNKALVYFKKALNNGSHLKNIEFAFKIYNNLGAFYNEILQKHDSALIYFNKNYDLIKSDNLESIFNLSNKAGCYYYLNDYKKSLQLLNQADSLSNFVINKEGYQSHINFVKTLNYEGLGDYKNAYHSFKSYDSINKIINDREFDLKTSEFLVQYEAQEKEIENLKLSARLQTNRILLFSSIAAILFLIIGAYVWINNIRKKKKIAEQESLIERQKLEKELKDQEMQSIDMILESQEKERKKIADELHDSLGSLMVSLKYNFNYFSENFCQESPDEKNVLENTNKLLDEAYNQVRTISHIKNVGLQGNEGLVKALQNMISKMTVPNGIQFKLIPFGLNKKVENQLEIFIFRIIQEMCTNIMKYAKATEVSIYLTQHGDHELNLMIEDNGIGFDPKKIKSKNGMGLRNIETRVEMMGGSFEIDSVLGNGTTITLNIPI